jgi:hypothetical protein
VGIVETCWNTLGPARVVAASLPTAETIDALEIADASNPKPYPDHEPDRRDRLARRWTGGINDGWLARHPIGAQPG